MSFYDSLSVKIYLMEKHSKETEGKAGLQPWYLSADRWSETANHLKLGFYKLLLAFVRLGLILRGKPASNFTVFTRAGKEGLYICNYSYCYYKDFHHKTRNKTIATIIAATVLLSIVISLIFPGQPRARAAVYNWNQTSWAGGGSALTASHTLNQTGWTNYSTGASSSILGSASNIKLNLTNTTTPWNQTNWTGGADTVSTAAEPTNRTNWTKFYSKDANIVASATNLTLANAASNFLDTTDADFNAGTHSNTFVSGTGVGASVVVAWYNVNWSYRKSISLTGSAGAGTGYQVKVLVGESSATTGTNVNVDSHSTATSGIFNDVRFTDSTGLAAGELSHWQESVTGTTPNRIATYWVKVTADLGTAQSIYIYYGNSSATSASNGANTFLFFDDFSTDSSANYSIYPYPTHPTPTKGWNPGGYLTLSNVQGWNKVLYNVKSFEQNIAVESKFRYDSLSYDGNNNGGIGFLVFRTTLSNTFDGNSAGYNRRTTSGYANAAVITWGLDNDINNYVETYTTGVWYKFKFAGYDSTFKFFRDDVEKLTGADSHYLTSGYVGVETYDAGISIDDFRVRKYASPEPSVGAPGAEAAATSTFTSSIKNQGGSGYWGNIVFNTTLNGGTITMKVRTSNSATMTGAPDWSTCNAITSGTNITGNNCVTSPAQYVQYQATLNLGTTSPFLDDVTIYYGGYAPSATLTSSKYQADLGMNDNRLKALTWNETKPLNTNIKFQVRTASSAVGLDTAPWCGPDDGIAGSCTTTTYFTTNTGQTIDDVNSNGTNNQWLQYMVWLESSTGVSTPTLSGVSLGYVNNLTGNFTSSAYNTEKTYNVPSQFIWNEDATLPTNTTLKFQLATSPDNSTWTSFVGPGDSVSTYYDSANSAGALCNSANCCSKVSQTVTCNIPQISISDGYSDQWIKYKAYYDASANLATSPILSSASFKYDQNTAPTVSVTSASEGSNGVVTVNYNISDDEQTSVNVSLLADIGVTLNQVLSNDMTGGTINVSGDISSFPGSGTIQVENEQVTYTGKGSGTLTGAVRAANSTKYAGHSLGTVVWVKGATVSGNVGTLTGITSTPAAKTATWTIKTDLPGVFRDAVASPAKIRVSANDSQVGNPTGTGDSAAFTLDTKNPVYGAPVMKINSTAASVTLTNILVTENSTLSVRYANASNINGSTCATDITSAAYEPLVGNSKVWTLSPDINGVSTVCFQAKDAYSNESSVTFAATPQKPVNTRINDISVPPASKYKLLVWWDVVPDPVNFAGYNVYRCDKATADPTTKCDSVANYSLLSTISSRLTNYCIDEGDGNCADNALGALVNTTQYYYKITAEDIDGISPWSTAASGIPTYPNVAGTPNGSAYGVSDTTPPVITFTESTGGPSVANASLADTTASVTFSATDNVSPVVFLSVVYQASATPPASYTKEAANPSMINVGVNGAVSLAGLVSNTKYYYKLHARDNAGNIAELGPYFFTTTIDSTPPAAINNLSAAAASSSSATLKWTAPGNDGSIGTATSYDIRYSASAITDANWASATQVANAPKPAVAGTAQQMTVTGLNPTGAGATYYFAIKTSDAIPNTSTLSNVVSADIPAQLDTTPPSITGIYTSTIGTNTAIINWTTDKNSSSLVDFGVSAAFGTTQGNSSDAVKTHSITLVGLSPATKYYFQAKSIDSSGNVGTKSSCGTPAADCSFTTSTDPSAGTLPTISSVQAIEISSGSAKITWSTGSTAADSAVGYSVDKSYALEAGVATSSTTNHSVTLTGLSPSAKYYYRVKSRNGNQLAVSDNSGAGFDFTTLAGADTVPPSISKVQVTAVASNKATITWSTDKNSNSYVEFGIALAAYNSTQGNPNDSTTAHSVQLTSLTPEKKYYFQVRSSDAAGNKAVDNNAGAGYTFSTTTGEAVDCPPAGRSTVCPTCETCAATDAAAPKITDVKVSDINFSSATLTWNTDKDSSSMALYDIVSYGVKQKYDYSSGQLKDSKKAHKVTLNNLDSDTTYYFRVSSADSRGNTAESDDQSFKTIAITQAKDKGEAAAETLKKQFEDIAQTLVKQNLATEENIKDIVSRIANPPIIGQEGPIVKDVKSYGATIVWQTDRKANSVVKFKAASSPTEALAAGNNWKEIGKMDSYELKHEVDLLGLAPSTTYAFQVKSQDVLGNATSSEPKTFTTSSNSSIFNVGITDITLNSAKINWETANLSTSLVEYGLTSAYGNQTNKGEEKVKAHGVELANLSSGTNYHFRIRSVEESSNILSTEDYTFATYQLPQITKYDLGEIKDNSIELKWASNIPVDANVRYTDKDTNETKIAGAPEKSLDHKIVLGDLSAGKSYSIQIQGRDENNNLAELPAFEVQTGVDTVPPEITQVRSQAAILGGAEDKVQAIISWKTNELSTSQMLWDLGTTKGDTFASQSKVDANLTTNHISVITSFKPGTVYRFRVVSADKFGNISTSPDYSILTPIRRQSVVQMIMSNFEKIFGWTKNLGR